MVHRRILHIAALLVLSVLFASVKGGNLFALEMTDKKVVVEGNDAFAFDLYAQLKEEKGNLFFSPFSISTALAMTYAGAQGDTATQMADALHFNLDQKRLHQAFFDIIRPLNDAAEYFSYNIAIANALWGQSGYEFHEKFINVAQDYYDAEVETLDFKNNAEGARLKTNSWVEEKTEEKIRDLLKPGMLSNLTRLVLTNAIYFEGDWLYQFDKEDTEDELFSLIEGKKVKVPMMDQFGNFSYSENELLQILEMPYSGYAL